jgi:hypothetical protein
MTISGIWLASLVLGLFPLWTVAVLPYRYFPFTACLMSHQDMYNVFNWISLRVGSLFLPGLLMIIFTILIGVYLSRAQDVRAHRLSTISANSCAVEARHRVSRLERQLTIMLLAVAISFILFRLPYTIAFYINHYKKVLFSNKDIWRNYRIFYAYKMTDIFVSINYASNFFLYCWCGSTFRKQLKNLFKSRDARRRESNMTNSSFMASSRNGSLRSNYLCNHLEMSKATKAMLESLCEKK